MPFFQVTATLLPPNFTLFFPLKSLPIKDFHPCQKFLRNKNPRKFALLAFPKDLELAKRLPEKLLTP